MNFITFIQLLLRNKKWLFVFPLLVAVGVYFLTRNMPHTYSSEMVIYTGIASGYSADNDISGKTDYHEANSKFDNLINTITSKETRKDVALRILAKFIQHPKELNSIVLKLKLDRFDWLLDSTITLKIRGAHEEITYQNLMDQISKGTENEFYQLVYGKYNNPFNVNTLNGIKVSRLGFSDMVKVNYTAEDAYITKYTLDVLAEVFLKKYKGMRIGEVNSVVKYFQEETSKASARLQNAEMILKNFRTANKVINYYEQTKYIADQKEDFEQRESLLEMDFEGSQSALGKIETKLNSRALIKVKSDELVNYRNELSSRYNAIGLSLAKGENTKELNQQTEVLKKKLKDNIQEYYQLNNSTEGIQGKTLLDQWLDLTVNKEETAAKLIVLKRNKAEFEKVYDKFAPMGSDLIKLERDVDVAEKEYLNLLHNLNQAKLRERNLVVTENISITDPANMPAVANSSKRLLLVIAALLGCFIFVIVALILKEYMDDSISNPLSFQKLTGLKTATAFAIVGQEKNTNAIDAISTERFMLSLMDIKYHSNDKNLKILAFPFHKSDRDYNQLLVALTEQMALNGNTWHLGNMENGFDSAQDQILLAQTTHREIINKEILAHSDLIYLFVNATRKLDEYQLEQLKGWSNLNIPIQVVMVDTKIQQLETFLGEIPKERSHLRKRIKDILKRYS